MMIQLKRNFFLFLSMFTCTPLLYLIISTIMNPLFNPLDDMSVPSELMSHLNNYQFKKIPVDVESFIMILEIVFVITICFVGYESYLIYKKYHIQKTNHYLMDGSISQFFYPFYLLKFLIKALYLHNQLFRL